MYIMLWLVVSGVILELLKGIIFLAPITFHVHIPLR